MQSYAVSVLAKFTILLPKYNQNQAAAVTVNTKAHLAQPNQQYNEFRLKCSTVRQTGASKEEED